MVSAILSFLGLWLAAAAPPAAGVEDAVALVRAERIRDAAFYLAADELEGRLAGHPGNDRAAEYIADHFRAIGLEACGEEGTYFQTFDLPRGIGRTRNIVGLLRGSDPLLSRQVVVVGAHMDHVGTADQAPDVGRRPPARDQDAEDRIWNGADDNASGTATVMEAARALVVSGYRPRRSVLFILLSAEEWGLLGARHYVNHPIIPLEDTVAMINLDMVGRNPDRPLVVSGCGTAEAWPELVRAAAEGLELELAVRAGTSPGSDHYEFAAARVPALHLFSNFHEEYHRPADHADLLAIDRLGRIAQFTVRLVAAVADRPERLQFVEGSVARLGEPRRRTLGISGEPLRDQELDRLGLGQEQGGILVTAVEEGTPAHAAGIRPQDVILSLGGTAITRAAPMTELRRLIQRTPAGREIELEVLRQGERVALRVRFEQ